MILIISQYKEQTTDEIIDWIDYFQTPFKRINGFDLCKYASISINNNELKIKVEGVDWDSINVMWFRRWIGFEEMPDLYVKGKSDKKVSTKFNENLRKELRVLTEYYIKAIPKEKHFTCSEIGEINKLSVLSKARELDIDIPDTYILTNRQELEELKDKKDLITKAIGNGLEIQIDEIFYSSYTSSIKDIPKEIGDHFSPSLFQHKIEKKYEIRSFLLDRTFYSMAIFSQSDPQTSTDFRQYNWGHPNRNVPYKLPEELEQKLLKLSDYFELNTGSFDIIKTTDDKYVFLEVNPAGQFGMVSYPCNYNLEKLVAKSLIKTNKTNEYYKGHKRADS